MKSRPRSIVPVFFFLCLAILTAAGQQKASAAPNVVPDVINYSGVLRDDTGRPLTGVTGVTFLLYATEQGGVPLWLETQNVTPDKSGRYSVQLGVTTKNGIPPDLFMNGEARWLAVQIANEPEQSRVLLVAVPYAMKALDAQTIGGLPPSAFVMAAPPTENSAPPAAASSTSTSAPDTVPPPVSSNVTTTGGTPNKIPMFTTATNIQNSILTQAGTTAINVSGTLKLPATGTATAAKGFNSQAQQSIASSYNSATKTAVGQTFQWQAEPTGNNTPSPLASLSLLFASGASAPVETGLKLSNKGVFTFAPGQKFPGTGTITGVIAGTDLTGGGTTGNVTVNVDTSKIPQLATPNTFTASQTITGNLNASGLVDGSEAVFSGSGSQVVKVLENGTSGEALFASSNNVAAGQAVIDGAANGATGVTYGLRGNNLSSTNFAAGVLGQNSSSSGITFGVKGISNSSINGPRGIGVFGVNTKQSNTAGLEMGNNPVGVWGDTGSFGVGVEATADEGFALAATNNSPSGSFTGTFDNLQSSAHNLNVLVAEGAFGFCAQDTDGNLGCSGTKSAIVPVNDGQHQVALYAVEAPQNWFEDFGSGQLSNGAAAIRLDATFAQTINTISEYHVFLTPEGDCEGLYVSGKTPTSFEVHELRRGRSNIAFDYRIIALRKGYEQVRMADKTQQWKQLLEHRAKTRATQLIPAPQKVAAPRLDPQ